MIPRLQRCTPPHSATRRGTYRTDFPASEAPFARNLGSRAEVLAWFDRLPTRERHSTEAVTTTTKVANLRPRGRA